MPRSLAQVMKQLADELEKEEEEDRTKAEREKIERLEAEVRELREGSTPKQQEEAFDELDDEEWALIEAHRKAKQAPPKPKEEKPAKEEPKRPRQRLTRQLHTIHQGDDEPDLVEYEDEEGAVKVRPGRKKGVPYEWQIDTLEDKPTEDKPAEVKAPAA